MYTARISSDKSGLSLPAVTTPGVYAWSTDGNVTFSKTYC